MANFGAAGSGAAKGAAIGTSILPGWGTAIGAGIGFFGGLFKKKGFNLADYTKSAQNGGYVTVPDGGIPGHPEWKPGTRQWIPPGSPIPDEKGVFNSGTNTATSSSGIDYDAIRAHAIAPTRAIYQNAMNDLDRQQAIGGAGGYNPGYGAQRLALGRQMNSSINDASNSAEATVANTRLQEIGQQNQMNLGQQQLDIERKKLPSDFSKGLSTTSQVLGLIGQGAQIYGNATAGKGGDD